MPKKQKKPPYLPENKILHVSGHESHLLHAPQGHLPQGHQA